VTDPPPPKDPVQIRMIGYWRPPDHYPDPREFVDTTWDLEVRDVVIDHLRHGTPFRHMMGLSPCRICGEHNGSGEQTDGVFGWPSGLVHYLEEHDVRLPAEFVDHVLELSVHYDVNTDWWQSASPAPSDLGSPEVHHVYFVPEDGPMWNALIRGREWVRLVRRNPDGTGRAGDIAFWRDHGVDGTVVEWLNQFRHHFLALEEFDQIWEWHTSGEHPTLLEPGSHNA